MVAIGAGGAQWIPMGHMGWGFGSTLEGGGSHTRFYLCDGMRVGF
jgi:hypothetical protein